MRNTRIIEEIHEQWAVARGYRKKLQASSCKPENLNAANSNQFVKGASSKHQAGRPKRQASSVK